MSWQPFEDYNNPKLQTKEWPKHSQASTEQVLVTFENGFGASLVRGTFTYGGAEGLWELGVTYLGTLNYDTPITEDVMGYLEPTDVYPILDAIADLDYEDVVKYAKRHRLADDLDNLLRHVESIERDANVSLGYVKAAIKDYRQKEIE